MPLKLNVGLSKKIGLPDYGSLGASCHVEVELDGSMITSDLDSFQRHVRNAYVACCQAVNDELARHQGESAQASQPVSQPVSQPTTTQQPRSGSSTKNGNGRNGGHASEKQLGYIRQLAAQIPGLHVRQLDTLTGNLFGKPLADLTSFDASSLIDTLKAIKEGRLDLNAALNGAEA